MEKDDGLNPATRNGWVHLGFIYGMPKKELPRSGWMKFKSYRQGRKAAKRGDSVVKCPYPLTEEMIDLLIKRDRWLRGWESYSMLPGGVRAANRRIKQEKLDKEKKEKKRKRV